eukprot:1156674-Pelagomonas_calceolata.AAC.8
MTKSCIEFIVDARATQNFMTKAATLGRRGRVFSAYVVFLSFLSATLGRSAETWKQFVAFMVDIDNQPGIQVELSKEEFYPVHWACRNSKARMSWCADVMRISDVPELTDLAKMFAAK